MSRGRRKQKLERNRRAKLSILEELGRLVVGWNAAESALRGLLMGLSKDRWLTYVMATHMSTTAQFDALRVWANDKATGDQKEHLLHAIEFASIVRAHRNHYVHTTIGVPGADDSAIAEALGLVHTTIQVTARKQLTTRAGHVVAEALRAAYDQTVVLTDYLTDLHYYLCVAPSLTEVVTRPQPSPDKPSLPRKLCLPPPLGSNDQPPP